MWKRSILSALLAGMWCAGSAAYAEVIDMTALENLGGVVIENPQSDVDNTYIYKWDSATEKITGGIVDVVKNTEKKNITVHLVVKASDLKNMSPSETKKAMNVLKEKILNNLPSSKSRVTAYVDIVEDTGSADMGVLRSYELRFTNTTPNASLGELQEALYRTPLINDGTENNEYEIDEAGTWLITKTHGSHTKIIPDFSSEADDHIYAAIRSTAGKNLSATNILSNGFTINNYLFVEADASSLENSRAYGIYNDSDSKIMVSSRWTEFVVKGKEAAGIYAGNASEDKKSLVTLLGDFDFKLEGNKTTGLEAGKNGEIRKDEAKSDFPPRIFISSPKGYGLYAHDGGKIDLDFVSVTKSGGDAFFAEKGGSIHVGIIGSMMGNIRTDEEEGSKISVSIKDRLEGDVKGNVDLKLLAKSVWTGKNGGMGDFVMNRDSLWNVGNTDTSTIKNLKGDNSVIRMNKSGGSLNIENLTGSVKFSYERDGNQVDKVLGGDAVIHKAAAGTKVTVFTDAAGLETAEESVINHVLDQLASRLYYTGYTEGEKNISGTVKIAEGLTSEEVFRYVSPLTFDETTGQAKKGKVKNIFNASDRITFSEDDIKYKESGIASADYKTYTFDRDANLQIRMGLEGTPIPAQMKYGIGIGSKTEGDYRINLQGHDLSLVQRVIVTTMNQITSTNIYQIEKGTLTIENPGHIHLENWTDFYYAGGISAAGRFKQYAEDERATVHIKNDNSWDHRVSITGTVWGTDHGSPDNTSNIFWINYTGIKTFDHGNVFIDGLVDINTDDAWCVSGIGKHSIISLGGGNLNARHYTAVDSYSDGTVNINIANGQQKGEAYRPGNNRVNIQGNIYTQGQWAGAGSGGYINLALTTPDSTFNGRANSNSYEKQVGWTTMWLQNGATWTNQDGGFQYGSNWNYNTNGDSVVENFIGGESEETRGVIYQKYGAPADSLHPETETGASNLYLKNYSGHTLVLMDHSVDGEGQISIDSGRVQIDHAHKDINGENAAITLRIDNTGLDTASEDPADKNFISETLNKLANKLYYTAYTTGEKNLDGKVEIAEGLTAAGVAQKVGAVSYNRADGQGRYRYKPEPELPDHQIVNPMTKTIDGTTEAEKAYMEAGIYKPKEAVYRFTEDPAEIQADTAISAGIKDLTVEAKDGKLVLTVGNKGIIANGHNAAVSVKKLEVSSGNGTGIEAEHNGRIDVQGDVKLTGKEGIRAGNSGMVSIDNNVDIQAKETGILTEGGASTVTVGGGIISVEKNDDDVRYAAHAHGGTININSNEKNTKVTVLGNIGVTAAKENGEEVYSTITLGLLTADSTFKGVVIDDHTAQEPGEPSFGQAILMMRNGATWTNEAYGRTIKDFKGSKVSLLMGSQDAAHAGTVIQKDGRPIVLDVYGGHMKVIYAHDEATPKNIIGGSIIINTAMEGSNITLRTDNSGLNTSSEKAEDKNLVSETLNALANKLYYTDYKSGGRSLTGKVEIAEGLTASAASLRIGDISYRKEDGQGYYAYTPAIPESQTISEYTEGITGYEEEDLMYVNTGVLKNGIYTFGLTPTTITAEKPIAAETDITIQGGSIKMELKNSGENKTALETGANTVTVTAGRLDMKEGDAEIKGGTLNAYTDIKGREIKVENGGKLHMAGNLDVDTMSVNGENAKALLLADKEGVPTITAKANTIIVTDKALLNISKGAKAETGLLSVNNASANFNDTVTIGSSLEAENGARVMMRNGGAIKGTVKAENEGTLVSLTGASLKENSTIEAWDKAQINLTQGSTEGNKIKAAGGTVKLRQGSYKLGDIEATNKGTAYIEGENGTTITGRLKSEGKGSTITAVLKGENSLLEGNLEGSGMINLELKDKARWKGTGTVTGKMKTTLREGSLWTNTGKSDIGWLTSENGNIDMRESQEGYVRITNYKGKTNFLYGQDGTGNIEGGDITIRKAEEGSSVNLITDNRGLNTSQTAGTEEKALVTKTLDNMARKLNYIGYQKGERNLEGSVTIAEGLTASSAVMKTGEISYSERGNGRYIEKGEKKETGRTSLGSLGMTRNAIYTLEPDKAESVTAETKKMATVKGTKTKKTLAIETAAKASTAPRMMRAAPKRTTPGYTTGDYETAFMKGVKSAMATGMLSWRSGLTDMNQRLGDIRSGTASGIWARTYGGKAKINKGGANVKDNYWGAQVGADKKTANGWHIGGAFGYSTGKAKYAYGGEGDPKTYNFALYGTRIYEDGQYIDIVAKAGRIENDYTVKNEMNHEVKGNYHATGYSLSAEYGKKIRNGKTWIEPQAQIMVGRIGSADYTGISDYKDKREMTIHQDGMTSVIGRIGIGIGRESEKGSIYLKASVLHDFDGKTANSYEARDGGEKRVREDYGGSWGAVAIGGSWRIGKSGILYGDIERSFGGDYREEWKANIGMRFAF